MKKLLFVFIITVLTYAQRQGTTVALEISADQDAAIPIGVVVFQPLEGSEDIGDIRPWVTIADDLDWTGRFSVKKLNTADSATLLREQVPVYISGSYTKTGDTVGIEAYLYDSGTRNLLMGKSYRFHQKDAHLTAHRFASAVHKTILGEDGPYESKIVYVEKRNNEKNIVMADYDGKNKTYLTRSGINIMPSFIDKRNVLCVAYDRGKPDIYILDILQGKKTPLVATRRVESSPNYSDVNGRVVFASSKSGNMEIYSIKLDGTDEQRLSVSPSISTAPNWSPNGFRLAFISDRTGAPQIYVADRTGANVQRITFGGTYHDSPSWSPDGTKIAYTAQRGGRKMIAVSLANGREEVLVTEGVRGQQEYPSWSPDGSHILFTLTQGGRSDVYAMRLKDKRLLRLSETGNSEQSKWSGF